MTTPGYTANDLGSTVVALVNAIRLDIPADEVTGLVVATLLEQPEHQRGAYSIEMILALASFGAEAISGCNRAGLDGDRVLREIASSLTEPPQAGEQSE